MRETYKNLKRAKLTQELDELFVLLRRQITKTADNRSLYLLKKYHEKLDEWIEENKKKK